MVLTSTDGNNQHSVTVPKHRVVKVGTLDAIVTDVARHLELTKTEVQETLFG